jgi:hypothetical protein
LVDELIAFDIDHLSEVLGGQEALFSNAWRENDLVLRDEERNLTFFNGLDHVDVHDDFTTSTHPADDSLFIRHTDSQI